MTEALRKCGFQVISLVNANRSEIRSAIREFGKRIRSGGVGLFYYAGHGVQLNGENYIVPVGADIRGAEEIEDECVRVSSVLRKMEAAANRLNIIILDACRNNPYQTGARAIQGGLARMSAPTGSILAYATAPDTTASDGSGRNGIYTNFLLRHMLTPGQKIEDLFKQVRIDVMRATSGKQVPWEHSSLIGDFYFQQEAAASVPRPKLSANPPRGPKAHLQPSEGDATPQPQEPAASKPAAQVAPRVESVPSTLPEFHMNRYGMRFNRIAPGTFQMGSGSVPNESPRHTVRLTKVLYLQETEVTRSQWKKIMGSVPAREKVFIKGIDDKPTVQEFFGSLLTDSSALPVTKISWQDAVAFVQKLNSLEGGKGNYRLPTEAEWEYACIAGKPASRGGTGGSLEATAWYAGNSDGKFRQVKRKAPNDWGLYDMTGNVSEWCSDFFAPYGEYPQTDPSGPESGFYKVYRGGNFKFDGTYSRPTMRGYLQADSAQDWLGLRLVYIPTAP